MDLEQIKYVANLALELSKTKEENDFLQQQLQRYRENSLVYIMEEKRKDALNKIKDKIPEDYKIYQWYDDVMNIIKEFG